MKFIESEVELEDYLSAPNTLDVECMRQLSGDIILLGAAGKMGPSLARRVKRASEIVGVQRRVIAVSRFSSPPARGILERHQVETISCDLLDQRKVAELPACPNVLFLAGRKFG